MRAGPAGRAEGAWPQADGEFVITVVSPQANRHQSGPDAIPVIRQPQTQTQNPQSLWLCGF